jgi:hypothetical protein
MINGRVWERKPVLDMERRDFIALGGSAALLLAAKVRRARAAAGDAGNRGPQRENKEAVRDLRRTAFSSQCRPIAGSLMVAYLREGCAQ